MVELAEERRKDFVCNFTSGDCCRTEAVSLDVVEDFNLGESGYEGFKMWEELLLNEVGLSDHHDGRVLNWFFCHLCLGYFK